MAVAADRVARMRAKRAWAAHLRRSFRIDWAKGAPFQLLNAHAQWDTAVQRAADAKSDAKPFIALLRSDAPLHRDSRGLIAELLVCRRINRKPGGQARPGRISRTEGELQTQAALVRYWQDKGFPREQAIQAAIRDFANAPLNAPIADADLTRLENLVLGKRGSTRRRKKRVRP